MLRGLLEKVCKSQAEGENIFFENFTNIWGGFVLKNAGAGKPDVWS